MSVLSAFSGSKIAIATLGSNKKALIFKGKLLGEVAANYVKHDTGGHVLGVGGNAMVCRRLSTQQTSCIVLNRVLRDALSECPENLWVDEV